MSELFSCWYTSEENRAKLFTVASLALVLVLIVVAYGQVLQFDYFNWDDPAYLVNNRVVAKGLHSQGVVWAFVTPWPFLMPLAWLSLMLDVTLAGEVSAAFFHGSNLVLHLLNTALVFILARRLGLTVWGALLLAGMMGLHPQHVESVVWISDRKGLLAFFTGGLALIYYLRYSRLQAMSESAAARRAMLWTILYFILSLLAKPQWVTLPFILLLLDHWPLQRDSFGWRRLVWEKMALFLVAALFSMLTVLFYANANNLTSLDEFSVGERLLNAIAAIVGQLANSVFPVHLAVLYPALGKHLTMDQILPMALLLLGISLATLLLFRRRPHWAVAWLWFLGGLFPTLGLVNGGVVVGMTDRWSYMPHLGLFLALAVELDLLLKQRPLWRWGVVLLLVLLTELSHTQVTYWRDNETLWRHTLEVTHAWPNPHAHWMLGSYYREQQRPEQAMTEMAEALRQSPTNPYYVQSLAQLYLRRDEIEQGYALLSRLLHEEVKVPRSMLVVLGSGMVLDGNYEAATLFLKKAIANPPTKPEVDYSEALLYLAMALAGAQHWQDGEKVLLSYLYGTGFSPEDQCRTGMEYLAELSPSHVAFGRLRDFLLARCSHHP